MTHYIGRWNRFQPALAGSRIIAAMRPDSRQRSSASALDSARAGALLLVAGLSLGCGSPSIHGRWDAVVVVNGVEIPFRFDLAQTTGGVNGSFFNGDERIESTSGSFSGD